MKSELTRLIIGYTTMYAALSGVRLAAPLLALTLGHGNLVAGILVALIAVPQVLLAIPIGKWVDRSGMQAIVGTSGVLAVSGIIAAAIWPLYPVMCIAALSVGAATGAITITLQRQVGRIVQSPVERKRTFSWLSMAPPLANAFGAAGTGLVIDHGGYKLAFVMLAVLPLIGWSWIRTVAVLPNAPDELRTTGGSRDLWREPRLRRLMMLNWAAAAAIDAHSFILPLLGHERGLSASAIGSVVGCFATATVVMRLVLPTIGSQIREWQFIAIALGVATLALMAYPFATTAIAMALCATVLGAASSGVQPTVMSMMHYVTPANRRGEALAIRHLLVNTSAAAMPLVFAATGGLAGVGGMFWMAAIVTGFATRASFGLRGIAEHREP